MRRKLSNGSSLEVRLFSPKERRLAKATQRAADSLAIANSAEFLRELTNRERDPHILMRWAERLRTHARSQAGLDVQRRHDLDFLQAVPVELWRQIPGPLSDWCRTEAPVWQDEVRQRIGDIEEIARCVRELKERPRTE